MVVQGLPKASKKKKPSRAPQKLKKVFAHMQNEQASFKIIFLKIQKLIFLRGQVQINEIEKSLIPFSPDSI